MIFSVLDPTFFQIHNNAFHINADMNPAPHQNDANLRPLVSKPSSTPFWFSTPPLWACSASAATFRASKASLNFDRYADPIQLFTNKCVSGSSFRNTGIPSQLRLCEFIFHIPIIPLPSSFVNSVEAKPSARFLTNIFLQWRGKSKGSVWPLRKPLVNKR